MASEDRQVKIVVAADVAAAIRGLTDVSNAAGNVGGSAQQAQSSTSKWVDAFKTGLGVLGVSTGWDAVKSGFDAVVSQGMTFEDSLNSLRAATHASDTEFTQLSDTAKALGNDVSIPGTSASETAAAMLELAKGGLEASESMDAARGTMVLAAAAGVDAAEAAQIQVNALNMFRLSADKANMVSDVLANSANAASGELTDMADALAMTGTTANSFGIDIDDTATVLALFAKNGQIGSTAGTTFNTMLSYMANPSEQAQAALDKLNITLKNSDGTFVGARSLTEQLATAKENLTQMEFNQAAAAAFGQDAQKGANILATEGADAYEKMNEKVLATGGAQEFAAANAAGLSGSLDRLKNSASDVALTVYEKVSPALAGLADFGATAFSWLGDAIGWFSELPGPVRNAAFALGAVVLLKGPLTSMMAGVAAQMRLLALASAGGALSFVGFAAAAKSALAFVGGPIGLAIIGVTTALSFMGSTTDDVAVSTANFGEAIDENTGKLKDNADAIIAKAAADSGSFDAIEDIGGSVKDYTEALKGNEDAQNTIHTLLLDSAQAALKNSDAWGRMVAKGSVLPEKAREIAAEILATGDASQYSSGEMDAVLLASRNFAAESDMLSTAQRQTGQAIEASGTAAGSAAGEVDTLAAATVQAESHAVPLADALKEMRSAASDADTATQFLIGSLQQLQDGSISAAQMQRQVEAAIRAVTSSARDVAGAQAKASEAQEHADFVASKLGLTLDGQAVSATNLAVTQADVDAAYRAAADASDAVKDATDRQSESVDKLALQAMEAAANSYNLKAAQGDMRGAIADSSAEMGVQRQKFIDAVTQINGGNIPAAEELANKYGLIPANVETTFKQNGVDAAIARAAELNSQLRSIDGQVIRYTVVGSTVYQGLASSVGPTALQALHQADGGYISGAGGPTDDLIPAMLSDGEFVTNAKATAKHRGLLEALNAGKFALGGIVKLAAGGAANGSKAAAGDGETQEVSATLTAPNPELFQDSWDQIVASTETAWGSGINPVLEQLSQGNTKTGAEFTELDEGVVAPVWANISGNVQKAWDGTILPTYDALNAGTQTGGQWQNWLRDEWARAWWQNQDVTDRTTGWLVGVTFPTLNAGAQGVGAEQTNLAATTTAAWTQIGGIIQSTYTGQIVPAWNGVQAFATATVAFFQGIQAGMTGAARTVLSELAQIRSAISSFMQMVGGSLPAAATGGSVEALLDAMADGGPITQGTGPRSDDVLIRVSKGEYVVNADATARNRGVLDAMNFRGHTPAFADGGAVGEKIRGPVENTIVNASHKAIEDAINKLVSSVGGFFSNGQWGPPNSGGLAANTQAARDFIVKNWGITNIGGWRASGSVPGSDHPMGKALDVMIANYLSQAGIAQGDSVANWFIGNPNAFGTKYVIWRDRINQGGAWSPYSHPGGNNDTLAHRDHVHLSFLTGAGAFTGTPVGDTGGGGTWLERMLAKISGGVPAGPGASYNAGAGVEQWRGLGMSVLQRVGQYVGQNLTPFIGHMLNQIRTESGGNPNAINLNDINAQRGDPSIGILQVIGSTFRNALNGTPFEYLIGRGQRDPEASMTASTLYSLRRYITLDRAWQGRAYDTAGIWPNGTAGWNTSGGPEMVLKPWQWAAAQSAIQQVTNQANRTYQGGQHGGVHIEKIVNNTGSDLRRELQYASLCARG